MKTIITPAYIFTPGGAGVGTLDLSMVPNFSIKNLYAVLDQTSGAIIYAAGTAGFGYTAKVAGAGSAIGKLTLSAPTTGMNSTDELMIVYDDNSTLGTNVLGYSGSLNFGPVVLAPNLSATYSLGACVGTEGVAGAGSAVHQFQIFRSAVQPSATLEQIMVGWVGAGSEATNLTAYIFTKNPTNSTGLTDTSAPAFAAADLRYLATAPVSLLFAVPPPGSTKMIASVNLALPVKNQDSTLNLYIVLVANSATSGVSSGDLFISLSGVQD